MRLSPPAVCLSPPAVCLIAPGRALIAASRALIAPWPCAYRPGCTRRLRQTPSSPRRCIFSAHFYFLGVLSRPGGRILSPRNQIPAEKKAVVLFALVGIKRSSERPRVTSTTPGGCDWRSKPAGPGERAKRTDSIDRQERADSPDRGPCEPSVTLTVIRQHVRLWMYVQGAKAVGLARVQAVSPC